MIRCLILFLLATLALPLVEAGSARAAGVQKLSGGKDKKRNRARRDAPPVAATKLPAFLLERLREGPISPAEADRLIRRLLDPDAPLEGLDSDGSLRLGQRTSAKAAPEEFAAYVEALAERNEVQCAHPDHPRLEGSLLDSRVLLAAFGEVDVDDDDQLRFHEVRQFVPLGIRAFVSLDQDSSGALSFSEYCAPVVRTADGLFYAVEPSLLTGVYQQLLADDETREITDPARPSTPVPIESLVQDSRAWTVIEHARRQLQQSSADSLALDPGRMLGTPAASASAPAAQPADEDAEVRRREADDWAARIYPLDPPRVASSGWTRAKPEDAADTEGS